MNAQAQLIVCFLVFASQLESCGGDEKIMGRSGGVISSGSGTKTGQQVAPSGDFSAEHALPTGEAATLPEDITGAYLICEQIPSSFPERELVGCALRRPDGSGPISVAGIDITWAVSTKSGTPVEAKPSSVVSESHSTVLEVPTGTFAQGVTVKATTKNNLGGSQEILDDDATPSTTESAKPETSATTQAALSTESAKLETSATTQAASSPTLSPSSNPVCLHDDGCNSNKGPGGG